MHRIDNKQQKHEEKNFFKIMCNYYNKSNKSEGHFKYYIKLKKKNKCNEIEKSTLNRHRVVTNFQMVQKWIEKSFADKIFFNENQ